MTTHPLILFHSPLVGTFTWQAVREQLVQKGQTVFVPEFKDNPDSDKPFWRQHIESVDIPVSNAILVGHSAAGALLPAIGEKIGAFGYIFVDAVLLFEPQSRLDLLYAENPEFASQFEEGLKNGEVFPNWQDEHLRDLIPDEATRKKLLADLRPRGLAFFQERIDIPSNWDEKPCAYLKLSSTYASYSTQAEARQWEVIRRDTHHFEMLTNPQIIAEHILQLANTLLPE